MQDCIFCKIVKKEVPSQIEEETSNLIVFKDINPAAPIHLLIVPKKHIKDVSEDTGVNWTSIGKLASKLAKEKGVSGFRLVHNAGDAAAVSHMHVHFLAEVSKDRKL
jgi:histidine triad (HIT) family protein